MPSITALGSSQEVQLGRRARDDSSLDRMDGGGCEEKKENDALSSRDSGCGSAYGL